jgi:hypothetical protein
MKQFFLCLVAFGLLLAVCGAGSDDLTGTYSIMDGGQWIEYLRVERQGDNFVIRQKSGGTWGTQSCCMPNRAWSLISLLKKNT